MDIIGKTATVHDKGFVRVVDTMGDDAAVVQAARTSYGAGTTTAREDAGLIRYLLRHWHTTPFEMCEIKLHLKMPIFVARQWIRHRTANINELSGRYSIMPDEFYTPEAREIQPQSKTNKQGRGGELPEKVQLAMMETLRQNGEMAFQVYHELRTGLPWFDPTGTPWDDYDDPAERHHAEAMVMPDNYDPELGMARELARINLPLSTYTEFYWKIDLHNLMHFLRLRMDPHAQKEIRVYADVIAGMVRQWMPVTYAAFKDYRLDAVTFSGPEMKVIRDLVSMLDPSLRDIFVKGARNLDTMSARERREFFSKLGLADD